MKKGLIILALGLAMGACSGSKQYHMDSTEKAKQKGYHAHTANKIIDKNAANRNANQKAAEKNRQELNKRSSESASSKKSTKKHSGSFGFY
jgi:hypothetical protein